MTSKNTKIGAIEFFTKERKVVSDATVNRYQKLLNFVNNEQFTEYTLDSIGIQKVQIKGTIVPNNVLQSGSKLDKHFANYLREGERFKPDVVAATKRKELKNN